VIYSNRERAIHRLFSYSFSSAEERRNTVVMDSRWFRPRETLDSNSRLCLKGGPPKGGHQKGGYSSEVCLSDCRAIQPVQCFRLGAVRTADGQVRTAIRPKRLGALSASLSPQRLSHRETLLVSPWPSATECVGVVGAYGYQPRRLDTPKIHAQLLDRIGELPIDPGVSA
jgi:hypothetical protein